MNGESPERSGTWQPAYLRPEKKTLPPRTLDEANRKRLTEIHNLAEKLHLEKHPAQSKESFWSGKSARQVVAGAVFYAGIVFLGERAKHSLTPQEYAKLADQLRLTFQTIGLEPDTNFARWQMSDFFCAAYAALAFEKLTVLLTHSKILGGEMSDKSQEWYKKNAPLISTLTIGVTLAAYEVWQASVKQGAVDIKDIIAYIAGLGLYLCSERIFQEYLKLKSNFKGKLLPFYRNRHKGIKKDYAQGMLDVNDLMQDIKFP